MKDVLVSKSVECVADTKKCAIESAAVKSELLCFVQEKASIMTVDDIVKICTDFYKKEEIFAARSLLDN